MLSILAGEMTVAEVPLRRTTPEEDRIAGAFADPALDDALRLMADIVGGDPDDGQLPAERWAWVHALTVFNDAASTTAADVSRVLTMASDVARAQRAAGQR